MTVKNWPEECLRCSDEDLHYDDRGVSCHCGWDVTWEEINHPTEREN